MKVYTVQIKVLAITEKELEDVIKEIETCNSDTVNCEIGGIKEED